MSVNKKPPIVIDEEGQPNEEQPGNGRQPGRLGYAEEKKERPSWSRSTPVVRASGNQKSPWTVPMAMAIIAILVSMFFTFQFAAGKGDAKMLLVRVQEVEDQTNSSTSSLDSSLRTERQRIDSIINTMTDYAKSEQLSKYATSDSVTSVNNRLSTLEGKADVSGKISSLESRIGTEESGLSTLKKTVEDLSKKVTDQNSQISELKSLIATINQSVATPVGSTEVVTTTGLAISTYNVPIVWVQTSNSSSSSKSFGLKIANGTSKDLIFVDLTLKLTSNAFTTTYQGVLPTLSSRSGQITWDSASQLGGTLTFSGRGNLYVGSGSEFTDIQDISLDLIPQNTNVTFSIQVTSVVINSSNFLQ